MRRREFLLLSSSAAATAVVAAGPAQVAEARTAVGTCSRQMSDLIQAHLAPLSIRGQRVWLKATFGWARPPAARANTDPAVVAGVVDTLLGMGAGELVVVDRLFQPRALVFARNGLRAALSSRRVLIGVLPGSEQTEEDLERLASPPDAVVCLEPLKHHPIHGFVGVEHPASALPEPARSRVLLAGLDATRVLVSGGPDGGSGSVTSVGRIAVSASLQALDVWAVPLAPSR